MSIKVSIVIPNWNGKKLLAKNLPAVIKAGRQFGRKNWEIIVVDDVSTDGSREFLEQQFPRVKFYVTAERSYFASVCNLGVKKAGGKIVVLLNNDVSPEAGFLKPLVEDFSDPKVFAVGCKEKEEKHGRVVYSGRGKMRLQRGFFVHWRAKNQNQRSTDWVCAGSGAFDRKKWLKLGGMDRLFRPAYEEDRDLSYRAQRKGWKTLFEPRSLVNHRHETTNLQAFGARKIKIISLKNQFLFVWKNGDFKTLANHLLWLPYHLLVSNFRFRGLLGIGFCRALLQLPEALKARRKS